MVWVIVVAIIAIVIISIVRKNAGKNANYYFNLGVENLGNNNSNLAIENFSEAIRKDPNFIEAYLKRGQAKFRWSGGTDECISDYTEVLRQKPDCAEAYLFRGDAYRGYGGDDGNIANDNALKDYNEAIRLNPNCAEAYFGRGKINAEKNQSKMIEDYSEAIRLKPNVGDLEGDAYYHRGLIYWEKGDVDRAIADYSEALKHNPDYTIVYEKRAEAYEKNGDVGKAENDREKHRKLLNEAIAMFKQFRRDCGDYDDDD
ncbi:MAG: tetratricopeptide repeat protein [Treponema sp.]|nr:tetratricopeptide repeat protein [Treponema sp.]